MYESGVSRPFCFLYMSGATAQRDQTKKPWLLGEYSLMRASVHFVPFLLQPSDLPLLFQPRTSPLHQFHSIGPCITD